MYIKRALSTRILLALLLLAPFFEVSAVGGRIYIRNRYNGGLFGYKYVQTNVVNRVDNDFFITNCVDPGWDGCRHQRTALPPNSVPSEFLEAHDRIVHEQIAQAYTSGTIRVEGDWVAVWSASSCARNNDPKSFETIKTEIYTSQEAAALAKNKLCL